MFRKEALDALDDPDRLGTALRLVPMPFRWTLAGVVLLIAGAVLAAALVKVPIFVAAPGILLDPSGNLGRVVTGQYEGRVTAFDVRPGDHVRAGQVVATLVNLGLVNERLLAAQELEETRGNLASVTRIQQETRAAFDGLRQRQQADINDSVALLNDRLKLLSEMATSNDALKRSGLVTNDRIYQIQSDVAAARDQLAAKRTALFTIEVEALDRAGQYEREIQRLRDAVSAIERKLAALDDKADKTSVIRSDVSGTVVETSLDVGDLVRFGSPVLTVEPDRPEAGSAVIAGVLLPLSEGKKVRPGMRVLIDVASVRKDVYGTVEATVRSVANVPSTPEGLRRILRNDDLLRTFTADGPGYVALVDLDPDPATPSGFRWTTSRGPDVPLTMGTPLRAEITVERVSVLSLLLPAVKRLLEGRVPGLARIAGDVLPC